MYFRTWQVKNMEVYVDESLVKSKEIDALIPIKQRSSLTVRWVSCYTPLMKENKVNLYMINNQDNKILHPSCNDPAYKYNKYVL